MTLTLTLLDDIEAKAKATEIMVVIDKDTTLVLTSALRLAVEALEKINEDVPCADYIASLALAAVSKLFEGVSK